MSVPTTYIAAAVDTRLTGIAVRQGNTLLGHTLLPFQDHEGIWLRMVLETVDRYSHGRPWAELVVFVLEDLPGPGGSYNGQRYGVVLNALLTGAAQIGMAGAPLRLVQAAAYGSWLHAGYTPELVGKRERQGSHGRLALCRAAWDMAGAAMPDGPPTAPAERAGLRELVTVEGPCHPDHQREDLYLTCQVCGRRVNRQLGSELIDWDQVRAENRAADAAGRSSTIPTAHERIHQAREAASDADLAATADQVLTDFVQQHPGRHLHSAGRDGSRLITPPDGDAR